MEVLLHDVGYIDIARKNGEPMKRYFMQKSRVIICDNIQPVSKHSHTHVHLGEYNPNILTHLSKPDKNLTSCGQNDFILLNDMNKLS